MFRNFSAFAAVSAALLATGPATAQDEVLTVVNRTGYTIAQLYISPNDTNNWEEDLLGWNTLLDEGQYRIDFSRSANTCWWDMKIVYELDEEEVEWSNLNFCELSRIEVYYDEGSGETSIRTN